MNRLHLKYSLHTLLKSDSDTDENEHAYGSASQGLWINPKAAKEMQNLLDRVVLQLQVRDFDLLLSLSVNGDCTCDANVY